MEKLEEKLVFSNESNCYANLDSLGTLENYKSFLRAELRKGKAPIKPYIKTKSGKRISLRTLRPPTGRGYVFDGRSRLIITLFGNTQYDISWCTGKSNSTVDQIEFHKNLRSGIDVINEITTFYTLNSTLTLQSKQDTSELEIYVTSNNDQLPQCRSAIEYAALAYQQFIRKSGKTEIPFSISIMPIYALKD